MSLTEGGGWRRSPIIAGIAIVVILVLVLRGSCSSDSTSTTRDELPPEVRKQADEIARYCLNCNTIVIFTREELKGMPGNDPLVVKARNAKCPTCGKAGTTEAVRCQQCDKYFAPSQMAAKGGPVCPHCGKNPYSP
jgi:formylmethanofuran dehydrogenase subunit E